MHFDELPIIGEALDWAKQGVATGASDRNWKGYGHEVRCSRGDEWKRKLLRDPQTSGGLLVACAPHAENAVLQRVPASADSPKRSVIGRLSAGPAKLTVT